MKHERLAVAAFACLLLAGSGLAQQAEPPTKIGFIYVQRAIAGTDEGKIRLKEMDDWARPRQDELARLDKEIGDLKREIMSRQGAASEDALSQLNRDLVSKQREFEDKQRIAKRDLEERQQALQKELGGKLRDIVTAYAEQNRYAAVMVLDTLNLVYLAPSTDLTDMVTKMYNEKYPLAAKAPAATPPK